MKNRLELAKRLLSDDGVIFVQCDDNEQAYLKVLMDDIFGRDNFVNTIAVKMSPSSGVKRRFAELKFIKNKEYIILYKSNKIKLNKINDILNKYDVNYTIFFNGTEFIPLSQKIKSLFPEYSKIDIQNYFDIKEIKKYIQNNFEYIYRRHSPSKWAVEKVSNENIIFERQEKNESRNYIHKIYNNEETEFELLFDIKSGGYERLEPLSWKLNNNKEITLLRGDFWDIGIEGDIGNINKEGKTNFGQGQKPERLIHDIIFSATQPNDIVLDFHLGSGTTCAVAHKMGRRYIGVEQMDYIKDITLERMKKVIDGEQGGISKAVNWNGGGSFVYCELLENASTLLEKISLADENNISKIKDEIYADDRIVPYITRDELESVDEDFENLSLEEKKKVLIKLVDKNKLYVNYADMNDGKLTVSEEDKRFTNSFYGEF